MTICRVEQAIWRLLKLDPAVSGAVDGKINHDAGLIDDDFPQIVIQVQRDEPIANLVTTSPAAVATIEIVCIAKSFDAAHGIATDVRLALDRYHGDVTLSNGDGCFIHCIAMDYNRQAKELSADGNDMGLLSSYQTFTVTHQLGV